MSCKSSVQLPAPHNTPEPEISRENPTIYDYNASNPDFVPGYSVLRIERAKYITNENVKTQLMNTIADDIVATVTAINEYHQQGILSDDNVYQINTILHTIAHNNLKTKERWQDKALHLRKQLSNLRYEYRDFKHRMNTMCQNHEDQVKSLENQVEALKKERAWAQAGKDSLHQSQEIQNEHYDRRCVSDEPREAQRQNNQKQMVGDDMDGEWEEDAE